MLYKHIPGSSLGGNVMTQEQSILKEMPYLYLMSLWIWRNVTKYIYTWSKKWKYFIADNILGKEEYLAVSIFVSAEYAGFRRHFAGNTNKIHAKSTCVT